MVIDLLFGIIINYISYRYFLVIYYQREGSERINFSDCLSAFYRIIYKMLLDWNHKFLFHLFLKIPFKALIPLVMTVFVVEFCVESDGVVVVVVVVVLVLLEDDEVETILKPIQAPS